MLERMLVKIDNIELNYEVIKPDTIKSDFVLLYLHEALGSIGQWKSFPLDLCEALGMKGVVYERQGHGKSSEFDSKRSNRYLHNYAYTELHNFIQNTFLKDKKIILIGHSDGGSISLLYANKYPSQISAIITAAAHVINEQVTIQGVKKTVVAYREGKLDGLNKYHGIKTHDLFHAWADTWQSESFKDWNLCDDIFNKKAPGLFIQGEDDQYGSTIQLDLIEQNYGPNSKLVLIPNCGHHPHLESSEEFIEIIKTWIDSKIQDKTLN